MSEIKVDTLSTVSGSGNLTVSNNIVGSGTISGTNLTASGTLTSTGLITASAGMAVGGTGSANTLDDYEEGTWTPADASGQGITGFVLAHNQFTKVGRHVFAHCQITIPSNSNNTLARLTLPFVADSSSNNSATGGICQEQNVSSSVAIVAAVNYTNGVIFRPNGLGNYSWAQLSGKMLRFTINYNAA